LAKDTFVGVSGFSYPGWKGRFYPEDAQADGFLSYYSKQLGSVEINSSFYAPPKMAVVKSWAEKTSEKFRFSFKAPKLVTHILKLGDGSSEAAGRFSKTLEALGSRRGPVLFQMPPYLKLDLELLDGFLSKTSDIDKRVFEFRHDSWLNDSTYKMLEDHAVDFCVAETEDARPVFKVTAGIAYFRLRKNSYDAKDIVRWAERIPLTSRGTKESYVYLRHDETGENAVLAQRLAERLKLV
jgi:uncharacterized protein YecE (DUF72 family)